MKEVSIPVQQNSLDRTMRFAGLLLVIIVWGSAVLFGAYILAFYFIALIQGNTSQWNEVLPDIYDEKTRSATLGIGLHFAAGGIILILGCIQLVKSVRVKYPLLHRIIGRIYVAASIAAALGGLVFIFAKGTIGGLIMDIGFAGYGVLTFVAAVATIYFARSGKMEQHRAWAIRLFALAIGSWLYRMDYGFWFMVTDRLGHNSDFTGAFDYFMDFFFYLPNLLVAEIFIGRYKVLKSGFAKFIAIVFLASANLFLLVATYFFTKEYWGPAILDVVLGR
ncbi:DUF2306 domain-containing protein [Algoriphagus vanfongensis]|uniref:DUF2306 domain-containing protein n=1 Tax=Algoriphagus vanfongensis TaxID=426371 RepID=UPI000401247A|nr:DUF2306 domain-containing protein [Algoriphagus vanfongensis]